MLINVVFLPLNLIASIGGTSEFTMMTEGIDWRISYSLFYIAIVLIGWLTAIVLRKMSLGGTARTVQRGKKIASPTAQTRGEKTGSFGVKLFRELGLPGRKKRQDRQLS
jgi:hypothetical protein